MPLLPVDLLMILVELKINVAKLLCLRRAGMCNTHKLHEGVMAGNFVAERVALQGIADDRHTTGWHLIFRARSHQARNAMPATHQFLSQPRAHVPGSTRGA